MASCTWDTTSDDEKQFEGLYAKGTETEEGGQKLHEKDKNVEGGLSQDSASSGSQVLEEQGSSGVPARELVARKTDEKSTDDMWNE